MPPGAPAPIPHLGSRVDALAPLGWTGREAQWLALVCLHSGVFTRAQYSYRLDVAPYVAHRFVRRLVSAGVAREHPHPDLHARARLCHISARGLYRALGVEHIRHRRLGSDEVLSRRLLSLDVVIERPDLPWLATEDEKVAHFEGLGIQRSTLPQRTYSGRAGRSRRYFHLKLPLACGDREALFVYADTGFETLSHLDHWRQMHGKLWEQLRERGRAILVVIATRTVAGQAQHEAELAKWQRGGRDDQDEALAPEERELLDTILAAMDAGDGEALAQWGGFTAAGLIAAPLHRRAKAADDRRGVAADHRRGTIDSFETHLAKRVTDDVLAT